MPELPEVETVRRGLEPHLRGRRIRQVAVRDARLRWPVPDDLARKAEGRRIESIARRGKYLIVTLDSDDRMIRSEEHTSELQSLMRISYAVFCLKKKKIQEHIPLTNSSQHIAPTQHHPSTLS